MLVVALLLLPVMGLLLIFMDRVEGMLDEDDSSPPSGRHRRHLRLISGHAGNAGHAGRTGRAGSPRQSGRHREGRRDDEAA
ncbi:hypothetical protein ABZ921_22185 [Streptomyces atriruber]|uniref:Secreted protein n=1 Tax=Streptomyces atriruber TaxID=545121 RepID=A0ABV3BQP7_9ACTN